MASVNSVKNLLNACDQSLLKQAVEELVKVVKEQESEIEQLKQDLQSVRAHMNSR